MKRVLVTGADGQLGKCIRKISDDFKRLNVLMKSMRKVFENWAKNVWNTR